VVCVVIAHSAPALSLSYGLAALAVCAFEAAHLHQAGWDVEVVLVDFAATKRETVQLPRQYSFDMLCRSFSRCLPALAAKSLLSRLAHSEPRSPACDMTTSEERSLINGAETRCAQAMLRAFRQLAQGRNLRCRLELDH
jgi:hypothetical protein